MRNKSFHSRQEILEALEELESRMPAHSPKAQMIAEREELEELLAAFDAEQQPSEDE